MKLTTGILFLTMAAGAAFAQTPAAANHPGKPVASTPAVSAKPAAVSAKPAAVSAKPAAVSAKPAAVSAKPAAVSAKPAAVSKPTPAAAPKAQPAVASKPAVQPAASAPVAAKPAPQVAPKSASSQPAVQAGAKPAKSVAKKPAKKVERVEVESKKNPLEKSAKKETPKAISLTGRRDPFVSPVVARSMTGSGCSTGKRCLAVDQISLKGVVKSDTGMIAVVVNAVNKAYFLRENDPVFNGYVVKITGDSIIFKETLQDKLGKSFTREVTKKITTPAV